MKNLIRTRKVVGITGGSGVLGKFFIEKNVGKPCDWCDFGKNRELCGAALAPEEKFFSF